jgi:hypothetical protein
LPFGEIGGDRNRCAVQLVGKEAVAVRESLGDVKNPVSEVHGLLIDDEFFECERHPALPPDQ